MKKRILICLWAVLLCLGTLLPCRVRAAEPLNPDAEASLTLYYQKDGKVFPNLQIQIYRVAEVFADGTYQLVKPFSAYPVSIHNITAQSQWDHVATTLVSYLVADGVEPDRVGQTDGEGTVRFDGLQTGLYLVRQAVAEDKEGTYIFKRFMVYLPTPQPDESLDYHVEAKPKCTEFRPNTKYTVRKLWQDSGNEANRPRDIQVGIYKDGVLRETQVLSAANQWSYTWYVSTEDLGQWTVKEQSVPEPYQVTVRQNENIFSIINTYEGEPGPPPTGDSFTPLPWILGLCGSGILLLLLGIYGRRRKE